MKAMAMALVASLAVVAGGCGSREEPAQTPEERAQQLVRQTLDANSGTSATSLPTVEVGAEGTRFDPPVRVDQLPAGVWYCDLGTVHYARRDRGSGTCPECGMPLTQKPALPAAPK